jgi:hypothetical protein
MKKTTLIAIGLLLMVACRSDPLASGHFSENQGGDGPRVTRSQMILRADEFARIHWTHAERNRTGSACDGLFTSFYPVGDRIGMGYKWGGWDDVDDFLRKIDEGYGTGAGPQAYQNVSPDCITGTSCTGLVSRAWHLDHKYTLNYADPNIERKFREITHDIQDVDLANCIVDRLKKGDALINATHVILYVYETRDGRPMIIDSSGEGVRFRALTWTGLASQGYQAIRYDNIRETEDPQGTASNPLIIDSREFPFSGQGNTRDVISLEFDTYAIAPEIAQVGPEVVYQLRLRESGRIRVQCTDFPHEGIDNDVHLLSSLSRDDALTALDCIASGGQMVVQQMEAGTYYIVVDSRNDLPGEYTLTVDYE